MLPPRFTALILHFIEETEAQHLAELGITFLECPGPMLYHYIFITAIRKHPVKRKGRKIVVGFF